MPKNETKINHDMVRKLANVIIDAITKSGLDPSVMEVTIAMLDVQIRWFMAFKKLSDEQRCINSESSYVL